MNLPTKALTVPLQAAAEIKADLWRTFCSHVLIFSLSSLSYSRPSLRPLSALLSLFIFLSISPSLSQSLWPLSFSQFKIGRS